MEDILLYELLLISILVLASNMRLEIIKPRPPLACCAVAGFRACHADVADLVADSWRCTMNRLPMTLKIILSGESLRSSTARLTTSEGLGVLQVVFPRIYVSSLCRNGTQTGPTVHQTDSSTPCRK